MLSNAYFPVKFVLIQPRTSPPKICKILPILPIFRVQIRPGNGGGVWLITNSEEAMMHRKGWRLDSLELKCISLDRSVQ